MSRNKALLGSNPQKIDKNIGLPKSNRIFNGQCQTAVNVLMS